jgi:hypothetical protein
MAIASSILPTIKNITYSDLKNEINLHINNKWHSHWRNLNTKLNKIKNNTYSWPNLELSRKNKTLINILRIGYTQLTTVF